MKRTTQTHFGNVIGSGHSFRGQLDVAAIPRHQPYPRRIRRIIRAAKAITSTLPKVALVTPLLRGLLQRFEVSRVRVASPAMQAEINAAIKAGRIIFEPGWNLPPVA